MRRRQSVALIAFLCVASVPMHEVGAAPSTSVAPPAAMISLGQLAPRVPAGASRVGSVPSGHDLTITAVLRPTHTAELSALLRDLYDPSSPRYEQWLTPAEFIHNFGPSPAQIDTVTSWLRAQGLTTRVQGMAVTASGPAGTMASALGVSFSRYRLAGGATGYAASNAPRVSTAVAGSISTIIGLSDTIRFDNHLDLTPHTRLASPSTAPQAAASANAVAHAAPQACAKARNFATGSFWTPDQVGRSYHIDHLFAAGLTGKGKTIALLELGQSRPADTNNYFACLGLHNKVKIKRIDGGAPSNANGTLEALIDTQEVATQAPDAAIISYEAPNTSTGEYNAYNSIVSDNIAQVISTSWGKCEAALEADSNGTIFIDALHTLFQQAAAQGQSVFAASGDTGSEDCYDGTSTPPSETLQVDNPADDPFVTGVGGTSLENPGVEPVWNDCSGETGDSCAAGGQDAGGGGQSTIFKRPTWQVLAANATCSTCREVPDISANAGVGETFYDSDYPSAGAAPPDQWTAVGGTSIAAPLMAGIAADVAQGCKSGRLGNFGPRLNELAKLHVQGSAYTDVNTGINWTSFSIQTPGTNDLTRTNAGMFQTTRGFDLATGFGTPIAPGLACPQVTSMTPNHGTAGTHVTLHGVGLERARIRFGSKIAKVISAGARSAEVVAPAGKGTVNVSGIGPVGTSKKAVSFSYPGSDTGAYRTAAADGTIFAFGAARHYGQVSSQALTAPIVGMAVDHATGGYWLAAADGHVYNFNAPYFGSAGGHSLNQPIVGIAATRKGDGYWLVARDGGIFAFGKARFLGSTGGIHLNRPIVGIALDPLTGGYWLVASDGGIFAFGKATFHGSTGGILLNKPIVGLAADAATGGYWLVASDGGVFAFDAPFYGSTGNIHLNQPIVGIASTDDSRGYRFVAADGGVFNFGDARYTGSTLHSVVVALSPGR